MTENLVSRLLKDPANRAMILFLFRLAQYIVLVWILLGVALFLYFYTGALPV